MGNRAVFLDRDGTLVRCYPYRGTTRGPTSIDQIEILPGVTETCRKLKEIGYLPVVVTNQPDVARGLLSQDEAEKVTLEICFQSKISYWYSCYLDGNSWFRKPNPGMIFQASLDLKIDLGKSWMVGDRTTDLEAGNLAGCRSILIPSNHKGLEVYLKEIFHAY